MTPIPGREALPVYILAGGRSRRFGSDKARVLVGGEPLLVRVARDLGEIASAVTVVAGKPGDYGDLGFRTIVDVVPDRGPMGGVLAALEDAAPGPWVFVAACDQVGIRIAWARTLLEAPREDVWAVLFRSDRYHPLFGLYHVAMVEEIRERIRRGDLKMQNLFTEVPALVLQAPEGWDELVNMNWPTDRPLGG